MSVTVFFAVILAALMHASWNAMVKGGRDKLVAMTAVTLGQAMWGVPVAVAVPFPAGESWPFIVASAALHMGYQLFLLNAYKAGDFTQVYPIARGSAPLIVTAVSVLALGVFLSAGQLFAITLIACGIISLAFVRRADGLRNPRAASLALATGLFIAAYSLVDGVGARLAGTALGFYAFVAILNGAGLAALLAVNRRHVLRSSVTTARGTFLVGGMASFAAYALVVWAFTQAPIALVTALREVSIVFGLVIGVTLFRETLSLAKLATTLVTLLGVVLVRLAR